MQSNIRKARAKDEGFTLIELLIVIVILGVLAGIVIFSVDFINNKSQVAACQTDKKDVETAVEAYYAQNGTWPTGVATSDDATHPTQTLVGAGVLKEAPSTANYKITYDTNSHTVTADKC
jgi:general secretion pathway protein G